MPELKPLKGAHLTLNTQLLWFIRNSLQSLGEVYNDDLADEDSMKIMNKLRDEGWTIGKDNFGIKAWRSMPYFAGANVADSELRVGVVRKKDGTLFLDIRPWGSY